MTCLREVVITLDDRLMAAGKDNECGGQCILKSIQGQVGWMVRYFSTNMALDAEL
jgi:hypothetical protein